MKLRGYSKLTQLSQGGMATLYRGVQDSLNRVVVIKFLSKSFLGHDKAEQLFDQESLIIAQLNHPNIIHVIDRGISEDGNPYFVMEYIEGTDLEKAIAQGQLSDNLKVDLMMQVCKGMAYAHKNGVIHRDIKPANILIDLEHNAHILDFGIAQLVQGNEGSAGSKDVIGTINYMSPEQIRSPDKVTFSSDIYSLGVMMFELFTNKLPTKTTKTPSELNPDFPPELDDIIAQCLKSNPLDRPASTNIIRERLLKLSRGAHLKAEQISQASADVGAVSRKFSLLDVLRKDEKGAVYLFEEKESQNLIVIKKRLHSEDGFPEARMLTNLNHPSVIKILGTSRNERAFIVVMEHLGGGCLKDRLIQPFNFDDFYPIALHICQGMKFCHDHFIIHGNLRPSNILFNDEDHLKISDFGFSEASTMNQIQRDAYLPPENDHPSMTGDIFSVGAIFYHMLTGFAIHYSDGSINFNPNFTRLDPKLQTILKGMLSKIPSLRYKTFDEVMSAFNRLPAVTLLQENDKTLIISTQPPVAKTVWQKVSTVSFTPLILIFLLVNISLFSVFLYFNPSIYQQLADSFQPMIQKVLGLFKH